MQIYGLFKHTPDYRVVNENGDRVGVHRKNCAISSAIRKLLTSPKKKPRSRLFMTQKNSAATRRSSRSRNLPCMTPLPVMGKPEHKVEGYLCDKAEAYGFLHYKFTSPGRRGVPDQL